jgi:hypothetical protein
MKIRGRFKVWVRTLVGLHHARTDHLQLASSINFRANVHDKRLDEIDAKIETLTGNIAFLCSMFGHTKDDEEPLTPSDLRTSNPWDAT